MEYDDHIAELRRCLKFIEEGLAKFGRRADAPFTPAKRIADIRQGVMIRYAQEPAFNLLQDQVGKALTVLSQLEQECDTMNETLTEEQERDGGTE